MAQEGNDLQGFWNVYTILGSIYDTQTAWESVQQSTLVKSCRKILPSVKNTFVQSTQAEEISNYDLVNLAKSFTRRGNAMKIKALCGLIVTPMIQAFFEHLTAE